MSVRNFLSGVEGNTHFYQAVNSGAEHVLTSYLHLRKGDKDIVKKRMNKHPDLKYLLDSGAHTLQLSSSKPPYSSWTMTDYEDYVKEYVAWLKDNKDYIFSAVELDIDYCVGVAKVEEWQKRYFHGLQDMGMDICYVWHKERGLDGWEEMCSKFAYVGLPGEMSSESDFNKYMTVARRYCAKVHGFAATKHSDFRDWPWFCMTDKHEILTRRGWLSRTQIRTTDFAYVRREDGKGEWQPVDKVHEFDVENIPIVDFSSRTFSAQVTENHRWFSLRKRGRDRRTVPEFRTTLELDEDDRIPRAAEFVGVPYAHYPDEFVQLVAWFWTEGSLSRNRNRVVISQSFAVNPRKVKEIRRVLIIGGMSFCEWDNHDDGCTYFQLNAKLSRKLAQMFPEKIVPLSFLSCLTAAQLKLYVRSSVKADGTKTPRVRDSETFHLTQADKRRADSFELACILAGFPVSRTFSTNADGYESYGVTASNVSVIYPRSAKKTTVEYSGKIWCISTKGQNFLTRCRDKVYFTGNSIDSITWKTSEMYGTLIVWDEHAQRLIFEQDKSKRVKYRAILQAKGFDAEAIIQDRNYKEVTRFALHSMTSMEKFYANKYKDRVFYYELRLSFPEVIRQWKEKELRENWAKMVPAKNFQQSLHLSLAEIRSALLAISGVQNRDLELLKNDPGVRAFLSTYFIGMIQPHLADIGVFQKEMASHIAPPNPPALARIDPVHFIPSSNVPKIRADRDNVYEIADLENETWEVPILLSDIE